MMDMSEDERRRLWEAGRTDVDAVVRRTDELIREARATSAHRDGRGTPAARRESEEDIDLLYNDLKSSTEGKRLGRLHNHNPYCLASSLKIGVVRVPAAQIQDEARLSVPIAGRLFCLKDHPEIGAIHLAEGLSPHEEEFTLAHECAHGLGFQEERHADQFARAFLKRPPTAAEKWRAMSDKIEHRAREDSVRDARALAAAASRRY